MIQPPARPQKGQKVPPDWFQEFYDYVLSLEVHGDLNTTVARRTRSGTTIRAPRTPRPPLEPAGRMMAQIDTDNGDGTYAATELKNTAGTWSDVTSGLGATFSNGSGQAGYLREIHGRKGVPVNSIVEVIQVTTVAGTNYWYFIAPYAPSFWAKITGETAGSYSWKALQGDAATDESPARTGTTNAAEVHGRLGIPTDSIVRMFPHPTDATKYRFVDDSGEPGSVLDKSFTGNHTEAARTSTTWDRTSQGSDRGTKRTVCTGVEYNDAGDRVIYAYYEDWTFDADGHLVLISAERRETVETPEECAATTTTTTTTTT